MLHVYSNMAAVQWTAVLVLLLFALTRAEYAGDRGTIERRFEELERRLHDHETVIGDLQNTVAVQQATIQDQQTTIKDQQAMIQDLQATSQDQQTMIHSQNHQIQQIQAELRNGKESRKKHSMLLRVIQRDIRNVKQLFEDRAATDDVVTVVETRTRDDNRIRQTETDPELKPLTRRQERSGIAFSAYLDHDIDTANHQTVKFNKIITNEGNGYNIHTGVFTCPEAGMYLLIFNIGQRSAGQSSTRLVVNSVNMVDAVVEPYHTTQDLQGGNGVLVRLKTGDSVWVETLGGHVEGASDWRLTTFSGVFVYP